MESIEVRTRSRTEVVDITGQVQEVVSRSGVRAGVVFVFSAHTTAG
ncbi:MAG: YjbQ family protein, partial [Gemmatimonadales bacterium]|nr:YjbQ family protein [Gemmatimonadales bacterium]